MSKDELSLEWGGARIHLGHVHETTRRAMMREAHRWIAQGQRPPILTVSNSGVDVSSRPELLPARVRDYRGLGRLEWVGPPR